MAYFREAQRQESTAMAPVTWPPTRHTAWPSAAVSTTSAPPCGTPWTCGAAPTTSVGGSRRPWLHSATVAWASSMSHGSCLTDIGFSNSHFNFIWCMPLAIPGGRAPVTAAHLWFLYAQNAIFSQFFSSLAINFKQNFNRKMAKTRLKHDLLQPQPWTCHIIPNIFCKFSQK